jgi:hypothetical protein
MGECKEPWKINSEIKKMIGDGPASGKLFRFSRFDIRLEREWIKKRFDLDLPEEAVTDLQKMDEPKNVEALYILAE